MRKAVTILVALIAVAALLRQPLFSAILDPPVQGLKFYSFFVRSDWTNGFAYAVLKRPFAFARSGRWPWKPCQGLRKEFQTLMGLGPNDLKPPLMILTESHSEGYTAFVRSSDSVIFLWGYPDFGGKAPTLEETHICHGADGKQG